MTRWKNRLTVGAVLSILIYLLLPLSPVYGELTDTQESALQKHWKYKTKYNKLAGVPLKEVIASEPAKKVLDKFGDTLTAIEVLEKVRDNKDHEAFVKVVEELEKKELKKIFPGLAKTLTWASWAKTGMELFKAFVWDPMLIQDQVDTYAAHRQQGLSPQESISYVATDLIQIKDLVKNALAAQYNVKVIYDDEGRILEKWKAKYNEALVAVLELEYNRRYAEKMKQEMERQLDQQLDQMSDELLAAQQQPQVHFTGVPAENVGTFEVGDTLDLVSYYELVNVPDGKSFLVKEGWWLRGPGDKKQQTEKNIAAGTYELPISFKIPPALPPGEYDLSFNVALSELGLFSASRVVHFRVGDAFLKLQQGLQAVRGLLLQCKPVDADEAFPAEALEKLSQSSDPEVKKLYEEGVALNNRIKELAGALSLYNDLRAMAEQEINFCYFEKIDSILQEANKALEKTPAACGLRGDLNALGQRVLYLRASYEAARERLEEGKNKEANCDYEGALQDYGEAYKISADLNCSRAGELAGQAQAQASSAKIKIQAKKRLEKGVQEAAKLIQARQIKAANDKLQLLSQEMVNYQDMACFSDLDSQIRALQAKLEGQLTVSITGNAEAGLGQAVDFWSQVMLNGAPVSDPDNYSYLWEATDVKPVSGKGAQYIYRNPGHKTIRLTVTDALGHTATAATALKIAPALNVKINGDKDKVSVKEKVNLTPEIADEKEECPCTYEWTASHVKGVITDKTAWFSPGHPGPHVVNLTVKNRFGQTAAATFKVMVKEDKLAVKITGPAETGLEQPADFFSEVTLDGVRVSDRDAYTYQWVATEINNPWTGKNVKYNYVTPGQKTIRLTVTDSGGRTASAAVTLKVAKALSFTITADKSQIMTGEKVNLSSRLDDEKEQCPCVYEWTTVNLNKTIPGATAWFSYPQPGTYPVSLKVTNRFKQTATATLKVVVKEKTKEEIAKPPVAPPGAASKDLNGTWRADGYPEGAETVIIRHSGSAITATKTKGNKYVPAGEVTWHGTYSANKFTGQGRVADTGFKNPRWVNVQLHITDENHFTISWEGGASMSTTRFTRIK